MCVCIYIYIYIYIYTCVCVCAYIHTSACEYTHTCTSYHPRNLQHNQDIDGTLPKTLVWVSENLVNRTL